MRVNEVATGGLRPDAYVVLDVPVDEGVARQEAEGGTPDRIESAGREFLQRVRDGYLELAANDGSAHALDGRGDAEKVHGRIRTLLESLFPETFAS